MKQIVVSDQPRLTFLRILRITLDGIRYRLFRASVTVAVIGVAVAFLLNILSESLIKRHVARRTEERIRESRLAHDWTARLTAPPSLEAVLKSAAPGGSLPEIELARMGQLSGGEAREFVERASRFSAYLAFFESLDYAQRRRLFSATEGTAVFDRLSDDAAFGAFAVELRRMPSVRLPRGSDTFRELLEVWPAARAAADRVRAGYANALEGVRAARGARGVPEALTEADGAFGDAVRAAGFELAAPEAAVLARQARERRDMRAVERTLDYRELRQVVARAYSVLPGDVKIDMVWRFLDTPRQAAEFTRVMRQNSLAAAERLSEQRLVELSRLWRTQSDLERAARLTRGMDAGWLGLGDRMAWLLVVSLLVCGIGIANAMLMTVTERFREIATLKCLGALDGFIMSMFVLESVILGFVGGMIGGLAGAAIGVVRSLASLGAAFRGMIPVADLAGGFAAAVAMGLVLAALAAVYPAFRASRLAPMEAMRVE